MAKGEIARSRARPGEAAHGIGFPVGSGLRQFEIMKLLPSLPEQYRNASLQQRMAAWNRVKQENKYLVFWSVGMLAISEILALVTGAIIFAIYRLMTGSGDLILFTVLGSFPGTLVFAVLGYRLLIWPRLEKAVVHTFPSGGPKVK